MFGWLKRRLVREHAKLLIQNRFACEVMAEGWYSRDGEIADYLRRRRVIVEGCADLLNLVDGLPEEVVAQQLALNKELRRLHDAGPARVGKAFDLAYEPLGGYKDAIEGLLARLK